MVIVSYQDERNGIRGVVGVGAAGFGVDHGFGVAVIGGDDPSATSGLEGLIDAREAGVHSFHGFDRRFELAGVAHHIGVGVVHDDGVEFALFDSVHNRVRDSGGGHFWL